MHVVRGSPNPRHLKLPTRLRRARKAAGLTRKAVVELVGCGESAAREIEMGHRVPTVGMIARFASALGVSAAWLCFGIGEQPSEGSTGSCERMGARLRAARTEQDHTKASLARLAELNPGSIAGIENGGQAGVDTVERLAKELRISPAWLAYGVGPQVLPSRRGSRAAQSAANG